MIYVPTDTLHRFVTGPNRGHVIVISPLNLEFYFWEVSKLLAKDNMFFDQESEIRKKYGQNFSDSSKHWN